MRFEEAKTIEELIEKIFEEVLTTRLHKEQNGKKIEGFYVNLTRIDKCQLVNLHQIERIFYNTLSKSKKSYGENNESDSENSIAQGWLFLYLGFKSALITDNHKLQEELRVNSVEDAIRIINDDRLCANLCRFVITFVEMQFKTYHKRKDNPDYWYNGREFEKINYVYLDRFDESEDDINPYEKLTYQQIDSRTGDLTSYILEEYFDKLTHKQQLFCKCFIEFGTDGSGNIKDLYNNVLYIPQEVVNYKSAIRKRLLKYIENDNHIDMVNGRMIYKD